jgi:hypothetical protein
MLLDLIYVENAKFKLAGKVAQRLPAVGNGEDVGQRVQTLVIG